MVKYHAPRKGSLGYVRKRAQRIYPRVSTWPKVNEARPLGFPVYKVGMLTAIELGTDKRRRFTYGLKMAIAATALEAPPAWVAGVRVYKLTTYGLRTLGELWTPEISLKNLEDIEEKLRDIKGRDKKARQEIRQSKLGILKYLRRKISFPKEVSESQLEAKKSKFLELADGGEIDAVRLIVVTRPDLTTIGKKKPEVLEIQVGGPPKAALDYALGKLGEFITVRDVFSPGEYVDVIGVTKGKGFQGVVKRFGVKKLPDKGKKEKRAVGSLGPWTPGRVAWTVPRYGQLGYFRRTEYNKQILAIVPAEVADSLNPKGGWPHYGLIRNDAVVLRGSTIGPPKRMLVLRKAIRPSKEATVPKILAFWYSREQLPINVEAVVSAQTG